MCYLPDCAIVRLVFVRAKLVTKLGESGTSTHWCAVICRSS